MRLTNENHAAADRSAFPMEVRTMARPACSVDGCEKPAQGRGWCKPHYDRWRRTLPPKPQGPCSIDGCQYEARTKGWCNRHYLRWLKHGDPEAAPRRGHQANRRPEAERFWARVDRREPDECWPWLGAPTTSGYGTVRFQGKSHGAHRVAWLLTHGEWPREALDHTCHNESDCNLGRICPHRRCVNPAHLDDVPPTVNTLRGRSIVAVNAAKTHCLNGHALEGDNLGLGRNARGGEKRYCRACDRIRGRATDSRRRKRAAS